MLTILNIVKNIITIRIYILKRKLISHRFILHTNLTVLNVSISLYIFGKLRLDGGMTEKGSSSS